MIYRLADELRILGKSGKRAFIRTILRLKGLLVQSVFYQPGANVPEAGDYLSVMAENLKNLETAFPEFDIR
jgi:hypothetical protein